MKQLFHVFVSSIFGMVVAGFMFLFCAILSFYLTMMIMKVIGIADIEILSFSAFTFCFSVFIFFSGFLALKSGLLAFKNANSFALLLGLVPTISQGVQKFSTAAIAPSIFAILGALTCIFLPKLKTKPKEI